MSSSTWSTYTYALERNCLRAHLDTSAQVRRSSFEMARPERKLKNPTSYLNETLSSQLLMESIDGTSGCNNPTLDINVSCIWWRRPRIPLSVKSLFCDHWNLKRGQARLHTHLDYNVSVDKNDRCRCSCGLNTPDEARAHHSLLCFHWHNTPWRQSWYLEEHRRLTGAGEEESKSSRSFKCTATQIFH